jgi:hypothetical protein
VAPDGSTRTIPPSPSGDLITPRLDQVGLWELRPSGGGENNVLQRVGVSLLSPAESDLTDRATYRPATQDEFSLGETALGDGRAPWLETALILLAAAFFALNWWVLRDRSGRAA